MLPLTNLHSPPNDSAISRSFGPMHLGVLVSCGGLIEAAAVGFSGGIGGW